MYDDKDRYQRYSRRRKSRRSSAMMMFAMALALLITGGALGMPWISELFGPAQQVSSANEAGIECPQGIVGLALVTNGQEPSVTASNGVFSLDCSYVLPPATTPSAEISVTWTENESNELLLRGCGQPPSVVEGVFTAEGSYYSNQAQARADYTGQRRYAAAMQDLASDLVKAATTVATPCPENAANTGTGSGAVTGTGTATIGDSTVNPSQGSTSGAASGSGDGDAQGTVTAGSGQSSGGSGGSGTGSANGGSGTVAMSRRLPARHQYHVFLLLKSLRGHALSRVA
jgi:hypothetical protein